MRIISCLPNQMERPWNEIVFASSGVRYGISRGALIDHVRDEAILENPESWKWPIEHGAELRDSECTLFIDQDIFPPLDGFRRLYKVFKENPACIVSGVYTARQGEKSASYWKDGKQQSIEDVGLVEADKTALGFCIIPSKIFENIEYPYFPITYTEDGEKVYREGEDLGFCKKAKNAGFKILVDTSLRCTHLGVDKMDDDKLPWFDYIISKINEGRE